MQALTLVGAIDTKLHAPADLDLDDAWSSEAFASSASHVQHEAEKAIDDSVEVASETAGKVKEAASPMQVCTTSKL